MHVSGGIDMNQKSDARHDQDHQAGKMVQHESEIAPGTPGLNPDEVVADDRQDSSGRLKHLQECAERNQRNDSATLPAADDADDGIWTDVCRRRH